MQVDYNKAIQAFEGLREENRAPSLHPYYVIADSKRDQSLKPVFFVYEENKDIFYHGFHQAAIEGTDLFDIQSPYGYGGPIASSNDEVFLYRAWEAYLSWCAENNILVEFIRFHPLLDNWQFYGGETLADRETVALKLNDGDILSTYSTRAKTAVRKAIKSGLSVEWWDKNNFLTVFPKLYNDTMKELKADDFYFFPQEYYQEMTAWNQARLAVCKLAEQVVAAAVFLVESYYMEYHLSASAPLGKNLGATNLLLHEAALLGQRLGCQLLHLGGGTDSKPDNSLLFFKSGFSKHRLAFKIGKHIHQTVDYNTLKTKWQENRGKTANRVLFYRF